MARLKRHYTYAKPRTALWDGHRIDRDRTTERIEMGERVYEAWDRCHHVENDRRCVKTQGHASQTHILATMTTLLDRVGLTAEEANA